MAAALTSVTPICVPETVKWTLRVRNIKNAKDVLVKYPVRTEDKFLAARKVTGSQARVRRAAFVYNYIVPKALLLRLESAFKQKKNRR